MDTSLFANDPFWHMMAGVFKLMGVMALCSICYALVFTAIPTFIGRFIRIIWLALKWFVIIFVGYHIIGWLFRNDSKAESEPEHEENETQAKTEEPVVEKPKVRRFTAPRNTD